MAREGAISAEIQPEGKFVVGETPGGNQFKLIIKCRGAEEIKLWDYTFKFLAVIGSGETALVENSDSAEGIGVEHNQQIEVKPYPSADNEHFVWEIRASKQSAVLKPGEALEVTFSNVISRTKPGTAKLTFESSIQDETKTQQPPLELQKLADEPGIIYFYSTTKERDTSIAPADEQILVGEKVTLKWLVNKLEDLKLERDGKIVSRGPLPREGKEEFDVSRATDFVLSGKLPQESTRLYSKITVKILEPKWYQSKMTVEDDSLEPIVLLNASKHTIYAVFRNKHGAGLLFQGENPFWGWTSMGETAPTDYVGSPGVYADDKLWFIGGSQIDPDNTSKRVGYFDPKSRAWIELEPKTVPWTPRMGHAVLEFNNKIWVMGGCDENRNALKDTWTMSLKSQQWSQGSDLPWTARCMFTCAEFQNEIWVYGGFKEPFSGEFLPDLCVYSAGQWAQKNKLVEKLELRSKTTMAACLQSFGDRLHIIGKTSKTVISPFHYWLKNRQTGIWEDSKAPGLGGWGEDQNLSYQLVNYNDKFLVAKAVGYEKSNTFLSIYVPRKG